MNRLAMYVAAATMLAACLTGTAEAQVQQKRDSGPKIVGPLKYEAYTLVRLRAEGVPEGAGVGWDVYPFEGVDIANTSPDLLEFAAKPGRYNVVLTVFFTKDGKISMQKVRALVVIEGAQPGPSPPEPNPPGPIPPPTPPTDPLAIELKNLYLAEANPNKAADLVVLQELYRQAVTLAKDPATVTLGGLSTQVSLAGASLLPPNRMTAMRRRIADYLKAELGELDLPLTPELRAKAALAYLKIHTILMQIGGKI